MDTAIPCRTRDLYLDRTADLICTQGEPVNVPLAARSVAFRHGSVLSAHYTTIGKVCAPGADPLYNA